MIEYEQYFKKVHHFENNEQYVLPSKAFESSEKWCVPELQSKKIKLNEVKGLLGKYKLKVWSKHTAYRDPSGFVMRKLSEEVQPELLTQAWCKFYEILSQFPVVPQNALLRREFKSLHLCEAPGAFVCALNHYLVVNHPDIQWNWTANTLNPNYEGNELSQMIPDDRLIRYTFQNWYFGLDFTGDITKFYNHEDLVKSYGDDKVDLVTADGSVDCMKDPGEQERHVEFLHFCEAVSALAVLQTGGTFVLKIFTIFEDTTINLLYLLNCVFERVSVFKPCSSKSGNSEVYIVNTNFKGFNVLSDIWHKLTSVYNAISVFSLQSMFPRSVLPDSFIEDIFACVDLFMTKQIHTILDNIYFFENRTKSESNRIYLIKNSVAQHYMLLYKPKWIANNKKIVPNFSVGDNWRVHSVLRESGYTCVLTDSLVKYKLTSDIIVVKIGKQIEVVQNSKFMQKENLQKVPSMGNRKQSQGLYGFILRQLKKNNEIINVRDFTLCRYHEFQKNLFERVRDSLNTNTNSNLIFINIPFHTHFLVGLLYILFYAFDKIYFGEGVIILYKCKSGSLGKVKEVLLSIQKQFNELDTENLAYCEESGNLFKKDIVQIIPSSYFDETCSSLIGLIWNYNNQICSNSPLIVRMVNHSISHFKS